MSLQSSGLVAMLCVSGAVGLWSYPAQAQVSSSAAVLLKDKAVTVDGIDHVLVAFQRADPRWQYEVWRPSFVRWLLRGVSTLKSGPTNQEPQNGALVIFLKNQEQLAIPMVFKEERRKVLSVGSDCAIPSEDFQAALELVLWQVQIAFNAASVPHPWSDKGWQTTCLTTREGEWLDRRGRTEMAAEAFAEALADEQKRSGLAGMITRLSNVDMPGAQTSQAQREQGAKAQIAIWYTLLAEELTKLERYDEAIRWLDSLRQLFANDRADQRGLPCNIYMEMIVMQPMVSIHEIRGQYEQALSLLAKAESKAKESIPTMKPEDKGPCEAFLKHVIQKKSEVQERMTRAKQDAANAAPTRE